MHTVVMWGGCAAVICVMYSPHPPTHQLGISDVVHIDLNFPAWFSSLLYLSWATCLQGRPPASPHPTPPHDNLIWPDLSCLWANCIESCNFSSLTHVLIVLDLNFSDESLMYCEQLVFRERPNRIFVLSCCRTYSHRRWTVDGLFLFQEWQSMPWTQQ